MSSSTPSSSTSVPRSFSRANPNNLAIKRIMREYSDIQKDPSFEYTVAPLEENLFEWHFTIRGADETDYEGGRYHGRILFPSQYPFKPPDMIMLTPSGRFETHKKICLSNSSFHPDSWQPSWSVRTMLTAFIAFFPTPPNGAIGSLDYTGKEKKELAKRSKTWKCEECQKINIELLPELSKEERMKIEKLNIEKAKAAAIASASASATATPTKSSNTNSGLATPLAAFQKAVGELSQPSTPLPLPTTPTREEFQQSPLSSKFHSRHPLPSDLLSPTPPPPPSATNSSPPSAAPPSPFSSPPPTSPSPSPAPVAAAAPIAGLPRQAPVAAVAGDGIQAAANKTDKILMYLMLLVTFLIILLLFRKMYVAVYRPSLFPPVFQSDEL